MAASVSRTFSTTADEIVHVTAGYAYWTRSDFRFQPENGNFPQRWEALPLLFQNLRFPSTDDLAKTGANTWEVGDLFFHQRGNDLPMMLAAARTMAALLSGALCWCVYALARRLFGPLAAFVALILAAFSPTLLAHGGLATSDTAATLGFLVALMAWWQLLHRFTVSRLIGAGVAVGFLALSKYSVVLFAPMAVVLAAIRLSRPAPIRLPIFHARLIFGTRRIIPIFGMMATIVAITVAAIWTAYDFRYSATPGDFSGPSHFVQSWERVLFEVPPTARMTMADGRIEEPDEIGPGAFQHLVKWTRGHKLLPEAYLYGLAFVAKNSRGRLAYFCGDYRITGWKEFFPTAFALKTTLPEIALLTLGMWGILSVPDRRRRRLLYRVAPLLVLLGVYWTFSILSHLNIGHRHLLPTYPACFVLASASVFLCGRFRHFEWWLGALLAAQVATSLWIRPDYLAYFNPLAGGPREAHRLFVDSSLDWGQDLPRLRQWCDTNARGERIFLSYFGSGSPVHEGIKATRFGDSFFDGAPRRMPAPLTGGVYCISATMFRRVYTHVRGTWTLEYEKAYEQLSQWLVHVRDRAPGAPLTDLDGSPLSLEAIQSRLIDYEQLQFGRLCYHLESRKIDARVGFSMLVFRLSDAEVATALHGPLEHLKTRSR
jgi:4-amino-4-deoxy-L-arabinose transferase-like glycosyltransferase